MTASNYCPAIGGLTSATMTLPSSAIHVQMWTEWRMLYNVYILIFCKQICHNTCKIVFRNKWLFYMDNDPEYKTRDYFLAFIQMSSSHADTTRKPRYKSYREFVILLNGFW
ncbi:hypothetical protein CDAR_591391 [Caerostris darwini]|uniref:Uncharacterized protein n=1 Tax=Caerostris darwini TaxID=1538125 RepID=A0AAV4QRW5_9ARAC|nr:hypothetical protein CDAR_591391 [Caerostris darwini]